uniref:Hcr2-p6 n=1 Tax=Solanum tuberosum TaxID=4113 RepID=M1D3X1_SOLTU
MKQTALLKWKATFKNQNNSLLASWTPSFNACTDWYGVICFNGNVNTNFRALFLRK